MSRFLLGDSDDEDSSEDVPVQESVEQVVQEDFEPRDDYDDDDDDGPQRRTT